jgi:small subunit ribosomal protein S16
MLTIRLQRVGKKKLASYRLIVSEKARDTQDIYLELLGTFNPHAKENQFLPVKERIQYWLGKGAQTSDTVNNLLLKAGIIKGKVKKSVFLSKKRHAKIAEKKKTSAPAAVAPEAKS